MNRWRQTTSRVLLSLAAGGLTGAPLAAGQLDFDLVFGDHPGGRLPAQITWAPDGERLSYVWDDGSGEALWLLDLATGEARPLLATEDQAVDAHSWAADGSRLLLASKERARILPVAEPVPEPLTENGGEEDPKLSPDGRLVAFVRDYDLHVVDLATGVERALTSDGTENEILNGVTDWVYWEELWSRHSTGYWWSPDGKRIAYYRFDEAPVARYPLVDFLPTYPEVEWQRYPKSGQALPIVRVGVIELATGDTVWLETAAPEDHYFPRVTWSPDGSRVVITQLDRKQKRLDLLSCDPAAGTCAEWMTETWPTWIDLHDDFRWLADGGFLWSSEKSGFRALYLHDAAGRETRRLSPPELAVTAVEGFDAGGRWVIYEAHGTGELGAKDRAVYRQDLDGGAPVLLSPAHGTNRATVSDRSGNWVLASGSAASPETVSVRALDGSALAATLPALAPAFDPAALPRWRFLTIPGPEGRRLPAALLEPLDLDPERRYPVIMYHYGGPTSQVVADAWPTRERALWHLMMAERGYIVLMVDNASSSYFGKRGADRDYRSFGPGNVEAQLAGVEYLKSLGHADVERIGLWGWSGGGYHTLFALTHAPGVWRAGVAGAPVTDWSFYDAIWTERYMDLPADNPEGYAAASPLEAAEALADALLIVHGTADDNVHMQNTIAMSARLIAAGIPFEQAIYPGQKHGFKSPDSRHFYERMTAFFDRELAAPPAP